MKWKLIRESSNNIKMGDVFVDDTHEKYGKVYTITSVGVDSYEMQSQDGETITHDSDYVNGSMHFASKDEIAKNTQPVNESEDDDFYVEVEDHGETFHITVTKEGGKWEEYSDDAPSSYRPAHYMGYLSKREVIDWMKGDYEYVHEISSLDDDDDDYDDDEGEVEDLNEENIKKYYNWEPGEGIETLLTDIPPMLEFKWDGKNGYEKVKTTTIGHDDSSVEFVVKSNSGKFFYIEISDPFEIMVEELDKEEYKDIVRSSKMVDEGIKDFIGTAKKKMTNLFGGLSGEFAKGDSFTIKMSNGKEFDGKVSGTDDIGRYCVTVTRENPDQKLNPFKPAEKITLVTKDGKEVKARALSWDRDTEDCIISVVDKYQDEEMAAESDDEEEWMPIGQLQDEAWDYVCDHVENDVFEDMMSCRDSQHAYIDIVCDSVSDSLHNGSTEINEEALIAVMDYFYNEHNG